CAATEVGGGDVAAEPTLGDLLEEMGDGLRHVDVMKRDEAAPPVGPPGDQAATAEATDLVECGDHARGTAAVVSGLENARGRVDADDEDRAGEHVGLLAKRWRARELHGASPAELLEPAPDL